VALALSVCEVLLKFPLYSVQDGALLFTTASTTVVGYLSIKVLFREILWAGGNLLKHTNLFLRMEYVHIAYY
jgi:hypothetical protein